MNIITKVWSDLKGRKTYIVAIATALYGIIGIYLGENTPQEAVQMILGGAGLAALRHGME